MATLATLGQLHTSQEDLSLAIALLFTQGHRRIRKIRKPGFLSGDVGISHWQYSGLGGI